MDLNVSLHNLVPTHEKLSDSEKEKGLKALSIEAKQLPKILEEDAAIIHLKVKDGDLIKITRDSKTAGVAIYYRVVIDG